MASAWPFNGPALAELLETSTEGIPEDDQMCSAILRRWLDACRGDQREELDKVFIDKGYPNMASFNLASTFP